MKLTGLARLGQHTDNKDKNITSMNNKDSIAHHYRIYLIRMLSSMDLWRILEDLWNYYCLLLPTIANYCQLLPTIANHCLLLPTIANYCHHTIANLRTLVDWDCCLEN